MRHPAGAEHSPARLPQIRPIRLAAQAMLTLFATAACQTELALEPEAAPPTLAMASLNGSPGTFVDAAPPEPFGMYGGQQFVRLTGRFVGTTPRGEFRVPYEFVVPERREVGNGTVLIEPPHFAQGPAARDDYLGREFLFRRGFRYASVGWSTFQNSILDPTATDVFIAGGDGGGDDEIVVQFIQALKSDPFAREILGSSERYYGYGYSQTSFLMHRILRSPAGQGLLDFTMLNATWWEGAGFSGEYTPVTGVGKVVIVQSEGDLVVADGDAFRVAEAQSGDYRVYEVAGSSHIPDVPGLHDNPIEPIIQGTNPTDWPAVARAAFMAGHTWLTKEKPAPPSVFMVEDAEGATDPFYGFPTGIARNADLNALGGVRLPDVELGRAQFIAADFNAPIPALLGAYVDLACTPNADGGTRFPTHGAYVERFGRVLRGLVEGRLLLEKDAVTMLRTAAQSEVGKPEACTT